VKRLVALALLLAPSPPAAASVAVLSDVRPIFEADTTRLVFEIGRPVPYTVRRLAADPKSGTPPRLVVDFRHTRPDPALALRMTPRGGPLVRLGATALAADVTRIVLDVPGLSEHHVFPLTDPFRLVVDVRGTPRRLPPLTEELVSRSAAPHRNLPLAPSLVRRGNRSAPPSLPRRGSGGGSETAPLLGVQPDTGGSSKRGDTGSEARPQRRWRIVVDPGHGGKDPGTIGVSGLREKDVVLDLSRRLARRLRQAGYDVVLTRDADVFLSLAERTTLANAARADLFLSVHANASDNRAAAGIETYYLSNSGDRATIRLAEMENNLAHMTDGPPLASDVAWIVSDMIQSYKVEESVALARGIQRELVRSLGAHGPAVRDLGAKPGPFHVLVGAGMPAVLLEAGFLTEAADARRLADPAHQELLSEGLLRAVERFIENVEVTSTL
jgi:N-acetylmuramoyl-L-alanine amidase